MSIDMPAGENHAVATTHRAVGAVGDYAPDGRGGSGTTRSNTGQRQSDWSGQSHP
jgi:hypothetical protein